MKRLLALIALMLGLAATVSPVQARMALGIAQNESLREEAEREGNSGVANRARETAPANKRSLLDIVLGRSASRAPRTIYLPTVMLAADRAHE